MNKIFLYVPNIVGYVRLLLLLASTQYEGYNFVALFIISATLDFVDGYTARLFDQATLFGSCFDMMIDRLSTVVIMYRIIAAEPKYTVILTQLFMIDFISHFLHFNVSLITKKHHKDMTSRLLRFYYNKSVLFAICSLEQICFCLLYLDVYYKKGFRIELLFVYMLKSIFHVAQLREALITFAEFEERKVE